MQQVYQLQPINVCVLACSWESNQTSYALCTKCLYVHTTLVSYSIHFKIFNSFWDLLPFLVAVPFHSISFLMICMQQDCSEKYLYIASTWSAPGVSDSHTLVFI